MITVSAQKLEGFTDSVTTVNYWALPNNMTVRGVWLLSIIGEARNYGKVSYNGMARALKALATTGGHQVLQALHEGNYILYSYKGNVKYIEINYNAFQHTQMVPNQWIWGYDPNTSVLQLKIMDIASRLLNGSIKDKNKHYKTLEGHVWVSYDYLARLTGARKSNISRAIKQLESKGYLKSFISKGKKYIRCAQTTAFTRYLPHKNKNHKNFEKNQGVTGKGHECLHNNSVNAFITRICNYNNIFVSQIYYWNLSQKHYRVSLTHSTLTPELRSVESSHEITGDITEDPDSNYRIDIQLFLRPPNGVKRRYVLPVWRSMISIRKAQRIVDGLPEGLRYLVIARGGYLIMKIDMIEQYVKTQHKQKIKAKKFSKKQVVDAYKVVFEQEPVGTPASKNCIYELIKMNRDIYPELTVFDYYEFIKTWWPTIQQEFKGWKKLEKYGLLKPIPDLNTLALNEIQMYFTQKLPEIMKKKQGLDKKEKVQKSNIVIVSNTKDGIEFLRDGQKIASSEITAEDKIEIRFKDLAEKFIKELLDRGEDLEDYAEEIRNMRGRFQNKQEFLSEVKLLLRRR